MEMMGETETERDRDQTNMARVWIEPPYFIAMVCGWIFGHLDQWKANEEGIETERDIGDQKLRRKKRAI